MSAKRTRAVFALVSALVLALSAAPALAAAPPTAATAPATNISTTGATLNGTVSPNKTATTYYFQYGATTVYSAKTASSTVNGNAAKSVSTAVSGLVPGMTYHFRIVATNSAGTAYGSDQKFTTALSAPVGPSKNVVTINSTPHTIVWGRTAQITGQVAGPAKAGQTVVLKASPYPYTSAYKATGQTTTTASDGTYAFTVRPGRNTRYEVTVQTKVPVTSGTAGVGVHVSVAIHASTLRPFRGQLVRFFGTVTPAHNGRYAQIQRRTSTGAWRTVASARLTSAGTVNGVAVSRYTKRIRVRFSGTYRVRCNPRDGDHLVGTSATRTERVH